MRRVKAGADPVGAVRRAVALTLDGLPPAARTAPLLVGWSGGADSTALLAAARDVAPGRVHVAVVDHGLQEGSARRSAALVARLVDQGVPAAVHTVTVDGPGGPEAAARRARYAALRAARPHPDSPVLLGHTLDDQAETVLLGLGRGSGARSLAGMTAWDPPWLRPLLGLRAAVTRAACRVQDLPVWDDPHNADPRFTRVRLRAEVLPLLEDVLAGGVAQALARTAAQLRDDDQALDAAARDLLARAAVDACPDADHGLPERGTRGPGSGSGHDGDCRDAHHGLSERRTRAHGTGAGPSPDPLAADPLAADVLAAAPAAVRRRAVRAWLTAAGVTGLAELHLRAADDLLGRWRGQGAVALPGRLELIRERGRLRVRTAAWPRVDRARHPSSQEDPPCTTGTSRPC